MDGDWWSLMNLLFFLPVSIGHLYVYIVFGMGETTISQRTRKVCRSGGSSWTNLEFPVCHYWPNILNWNHSVQACGDPHRWGESHLLQAEGTKTHRFCWMPCWYPSITINTRLQVTWPAGPWEVWCLSCLRKWIRCQWIRLKLLELPSICTFLK